MEVTIRRASIAESTLPMVAPTSLEGRACPIARSLHHVGEWWSMMILRDAHHGLTRFDQFEQNLGIAPNTLTRRLKSLTTAGLLERRLYCERPRRYEYILTPSGRDFAGVLNVLLTYGNRHFAPEGRSVMVIDSTTGQEVEPELVDRASGLPISDPRFRWAAGPAANDRIRNRYLMGPPRNGERQ